MLNISFLEEFLYYYWLKRIDPHKGTGKIGK